MGNNYMIENTTKRQNSVVQERTGKYRLWHNTAQQQKQKLSWMFKNEWAERREKCYARREGGKSFDKNRKVEMSMVPMGDVICFGKPLNDLLQKKKDKAYTSKGRNRYKRIQEM